jgi:putative NIF3 family GTP cyclohydrolase 1 type 2
MSSSYKHNIGRRNFITATTTTALGSVLLPFVAKSSSAQEKDITIKEAIDLIIKSIPVSPFTETVDTVKAGNVNQVLKGIVTTSFATIGIIEKAAVAGANFIIAHEPTFYNHQDETDWLKQDDVYQYKRALIDKHGIVIWRFHDYWHSDKPDGVLAGVLDKLGWQKFADPQQQHVLHIPGATFGNLVEEIKHKLEIPSVKSIGKATDKCGRILMMPGAAGGRAHINGIESVKPDLLICGELQEWETSEYIRDARAIGNNISLMVLGHAVSEEPGMSWLVPWLQPKLPGVKITHIPSHSPFTWY